MQGYRPENPLIVQGDKSILLEVDNPQYADARDALARFAELEKSPEYVHTYRLTPLSLWNAAAAGLTAQAILEGLNKFSKYPLPDNVRIDITDAIGRYGRIKIVVEDGRMLLISDDASLMEEISRHKLFQPLMKAKLGRTTFEIDPGQRGHVKRVLMQIGYPAEDLAGYTEGEYFPFDLRGLGAHTGAPFDLRHYQSEAADVYWAGGSAAGGSGVIVLPCGAGKTIVGIAAMARAQCATLILSPNTVAVRQWIREILDKTTITEDQIGEYTGLKKEIRPITVTTYQVLIYHTLKRKAKAGANALVPMNGNGANVKADDIDGSDDIDMAEVLAAMAQPASSRSKPEADWVTPSGRKGKIPKKLPNLSEYPHMELFTSLNWGLIIYDEVHLLPAPVFRMTAEIQSRRRLGLTATLVREDGAESDVFSLVGPKKYDVPWKDLERQGWIATAECHEIRVALDDDDRMEYAVTSQEKKYRFAATSQKKLPMISMLMHKHRDDEVIVIGQFIDQLQAIAARIGAPLIMGETPVREREKLFQQFRTGEITKLVLSRVGNFSIDLPDANVLIQVSGMFGSRQEEAQRLGRVLRPKANGLLAHFYSIVTRDTLDQEFASKRQMFLTEQGYHYDIMYEDEVAAYQPAIIAQDATPIRRTTSGLLHS
jgi:DNA excision repair protein ERCC-3